MQRVISIINAKTPHIWSGDPKAWQLSLQGVGRGPGFQTRCEGSVVPCFDKSALPHAVFSCSFIIAFCRLNCNKNLAPPAPPTPSHRPAVSVAVDCRSLLQTCQRTRGRTSPGPALPDSRSTHHGTARSHGAVGAGVCMVAGRRSFCLLKEVFALDLHHTPVRVMPHDSLDTSRL